MIHPLLFWYSSQPAEVKAAIILGGISIVTVCLGFLIKDYIIPRLLDKQKRKNEKLEAFLNYRIPLIQSAASLERRLEELFRTRSHILWGDSPNSDFYNYKSMSTNYRLCSLLGWIYAYKLEESHLQAPSKELNKAINKHIETFRTSLADGQGVEMEVARKIAQLLQIEEEKTGLLERFSVQIDHLVQEAITPKQRLLLSECCDEEQEKFLTSLSKLIKEIFCKQIDSEALKELDVIRITSVRLGLIYRDWQQAIGDLMTVKNSSPNGRGYDVISYLKFEEILCGEPCLKQKWLFRTMRLFEDLDVSKENEFDNRVAQLKQVKKALEHLLEALEKRNNLFPNLQ